MSERLRFPAESSTRPGETRPHPGRHRRGTGHSLAKWAGLGFLYLALTGPFGLVWADDTAAEPEQPESRGEAQTQVELAEQAEAKAREEAEARAAQLDAALRSAAARGHVRTVRELLQSGANPNTVDADGVTPLMLAVTGDNPKVRQTAKHGFDDDIERDIERMRKHIHGHIPTARALIKGGARVNGATPRGITALSLAVIGDEKRMVLYLISAGADVNQRAKRGETALMVAAAAGHSETAEILLAAGADPDLETKDGITAAWIAIFAGNFSTASVISGND